MSSIPLGPDDSVMKVFKFPLTQDRDVRPEGSHTLRPGDSAEAQPLTISARDLLALLSKRRLHISQIKFPENHFQDGGSYADVSMATLIAEDNTQDEPRKVAVKKLRIILTGDTDEEKFLRLFVNELRVLDRLSHPNIVKVIGFVEDIDSRIAWLVFPWEANGNLREFLRSGDWDIPERVSLVRDVAFGLEYLHTRDPPICHGDLKSLNILVNSSYRALITDFGSARALTELEATSSSSSPAPAKRRILEYEECPPIEVLTSNTTLTLTGPVCSFRWAGPEVINGEQPGLASDVWALAWIAWEAITDQYPFEELDNEWAVTMRIVEGQLPSASDHGRLAQIRRLCSLMMKWWRLDPKERPSAVHCVANLRGLPSIIPSPRNNGKSEIQSAMLVLQIGEMHRLQNRYEEASVKFEEGLAIAQSTGNKPAIALALFRLGEIHRKQLEYAKAEECYLKFLDMSTHDADRASAFRGLAGVHRALSKFTEAEECYTKSLNIFTNIRDDFGRASALSGLGYLYQRWSKYPEAEKCYIRSLEIYTGIGDDVGQADVINGLGDIHQTRLECDKAEECYTKLLDISASIGDSKGRVNALNGLGGVHRLRLKYTEAEECYTQSLDISSSMGYTLGRLCAYFGLGDTHFEQSKYDEAKECYTQSLAISTSIGDQKSQAIALGRLGGIYRAQSKYDEAKECYTQSLAISTSIGDQKSQAIALGRLGGIYRAQSKYSEAEACFAQMMDIFTTIGYELGQANALFQLGYLHEKQSNYTEANECYTQALDIATDAGLGEFQVNTLRELGNIHRRQSKYAEAEDCYTKARDIAKSIGYDLGEVHALLALGLLRLLESRLAEAKAFFTEVTEISNRINYEEGKHLSKVSLSFVARAARTMKQSPVTLPPSNTATELTTVASAPNQAPSSIRHRFKETLSAFIGRPSSAPDSSEPRSRRLLPNVRSVLFGSRKPTNT